MLDKYIDHCRNHSYMSGIDRAKLRVKQNGEVFTPTELAILAINKSFPKQLSEKWKEVIVL